MEACGMCGGPLFFLGFLGSIAHFRCQCCGMRFHDDNLNDCADENGNLIVE